MQSSSATGGAPDGGLRRDPLSRVSRSNSEFDSASLERLNVGSADVLRPRGLSFRPRTISIMSFEEGPPRWLGAVNEAGEQPSSISGSASLHAAMASRHATNAAMLAKARMIDQVKDALRLDVEDRSDGQVELLRDWASNHVEIRDERMLSVRRHHLDALISAMEVRFHSAEDVLFNQEETGDDFYIVLSGGVGMFSRMARTHVKPDQLSIDIREAAQMGGSDLSDHEMNWAHAVQRYGQCLTVCHVGQSFGELGAVHELPRTATAVVVRTSMVSRFVSCAPVSGARCSHLCLALPCLASSTAPRGPQRGQGHASQPAPPSASRGPGPPQLVVLHLHKLLRNVRLARQLHLHDAPTFLPQVSQFARCEPAEINRLQYRMRATSVQAGQALFEDGLPATHVVLIKSGTVSVRLPVVRFVTPTGKAASFREERDLAAFGPCTLLGELDGPPNSAALNALHSYSAWTVTDCELFVIERDELLHALTDATIGRCKQLHAERWAQWEEDLQHGAAMLSQLELEHMRQKRAAVADAALRAKLRAHGKQLSRSARLYGAVWDEASCSYVTPGHAIGRRPGEDRDVPLRRERMPLYGRGAHNDRAIRAKLHAQSAPPAPRPKLELAELVGARLPPAYANAAGNAAGPHGCGCGCRPSTAGAPVAVGALAASAAAAVAAVPLAGDAPPERPSTAPVGACAQAAAAAGAAPAAKALLEPLRVPPREWANFVPSPVMSIRSFSERKHWPRVGMPGGPEAAEEKPGGSNAGKKAYAAPYRPVPVIARGFRPGKRLTDVWR